MAATVLVEALAELNDFAGAREVLERYGLDGELPPMNGFSFLVLARAHMNAASGDHGAALADLDEAASRLAAWGMKNPAAASWRSDKALVLLRRGERQEALRLADEELRLAERFGAARAHGVALRARGVIEGARKGSGSWRARSEVLSSSVARLEYARTLVELGAALRRANARGEARRRLDEGLEIARRCGADAVAERARSELGAIGVRRRRAEEAGIDALTASERRVAELAASGMGNAEIAAELFIARRTVETHLTHTYAKLGIRSRKGLPDALTAD